MLWKLDLIINPNMSRAEDDEEGTKTEGSAAVPNEEEQEYGQVIREMPFRRGEAEDEG